MPTAIPEIFRIRLLEVSPIYRLPSGSRAIAKGALKLSWAAIAALASSTDHYTVVFTKDSGAQNPNQGGSPYNAGLVNSLIFTGLTNDKHYTFTIQARNSSNILLDSSNSVTAVTADNFLYLPLILR